MDLELQTKLDELFNLLDNLPCIKNIEKIKGNIDDELKTLISNYRSNPTVDNKMKLYKNEKYLEYIKNETELNYLIMNINNKFRRKSGNCESN